MVDVIQEQRTPMCQVPGLPETGGKTFVLVPGSWAGGWIWAPVAERLRAQGHRVFTPTQTGLGERRHLLSPNISIDTFVDDIANLLEAEDLQDVILVGHSFGGIPITGVADRMPERIRHLEHFWFSQVQSSPGGLGRDCQTAAS
jgi:pimeloyl-ACP methyl ester carboxylesterase